MKKNSIKTLIENLKINESALYIKGVTIVIKINEAIIFILIKYLVLLFNNL